MTIPIVLLICVAIAGCGGGKQQEGDPASRATATPEQTTDAETELREVFHAYNSALDARDWDAMCERLAPESVASMREALRVIYDVNPPRDCSQVFDEFTTRGGEELTRIALGDIGKTAAVDSVTVTGDTAVLRWHYRKRGQWWGPLSMPARRIDGEWKLVDPED